MKKRIAWLVVSGLMVLSLVLASCAPAVTEEEEVVTEEKEVVTEEKEVVTEGKEVVAEEETGMVRDALGKLVPKPQYGGVLNVVHKTDPRNGFSFPTMQYASAREHMRISNEELLQKDRLKGPGGTGEWDGMNVIYPTPDILTGLLAESFEIIEPDTLIFHIRKGVYWQDKPPANGAEMTAEDVVYTYVFWWSRSGSIWSVNYPVISNIENPEESIYVDPDDPWTVVFKAAPGKLGLLWEIVANKSYIFPKALGPIEGEGFGSWRGVVGTGPFLLTDYVSGSSLTWERNPNYWQKDPLHPENQLPYLDGIRSFIISDLSTQEAALRTGKLDIVMFIPTEDGESLMRSNPDLLFKEMLARRKTMHMRHDVAPFDDVNVRRAMMMAIDHDEIIEEYYGGKAHKFYWPAFPVPEHSLAYTPLEEMPESVQELYGYHPDKAMQLLDEAGLPGPDRFATSIIVDAAEKPDIDLLSIVKAYWAEVGVDLEIRVKEAGVFKKMSKAFSYEHGAVASADMSMKFTSFSMGNDKNQARIDEPLVDAANAAGGAAYFDWPERARIIKEATPALQNLALVIFLPLQVQYTVWQPWVGGFHGETQPAHITRQYMANVGRYVWIDQDMKKEMTGRR